MPLGSRLILMIMRMTLGPLEYSLYNDIPCQHVSIKSKWVRGDQLHELHHKVCERSHFVTECSSVTNGTPHRLPGKLTKSNTIKLHPCSSVMASRRSSIYKQDKIILVENDRVLTEPSCVAEVSNDYFANVAETGDNTD